MRLELEQIERIERYLMQKMDKNERIHFEEELNTNVNLKQQTGFQHGLMDGIRWLGLKNATQRAYRRFKLIRGLKIGAFALAIAGGLAAAIVFWKGNESQVNYEERNTNVEVVIPAVESSGINESEESVDALLLPQDEPLIKQSNRTLNCWQQRITTEGHEQIDEAEDVQHGVSQQNDSTVIIRESLIVTDTVMKFIVIPEDGNRLP